MDNLICLESWWKWPLKEMPECFERELTEVFPQWLENLATGDATVGSYLLASLWLLFIILPCLLFIGFWTIEFCERYGKYLVHLPPVGLIGVFFYDRPAQDGPLILAIMVGAYYGCFGFVWLCWWCGQKMEGREPLLVSLGRWCGRKIRTWRNPRSRN